MLAQEGVVVVKLADTKLPETAGQVALTLQLYKLPCVNPVRFAVVEVGVASVTGVQIVAAFNLYSTV